MCARKPQNWTEAWCDSRTVTAHATQEGRRGEGRGLQGTKGACAYNHARMLGADDSDLAPVAGARQARTTSDIEHQSCDRKMLDVRIKRFSPCAEFKAAFFGQTALPTIRRPRRAS